MEPRGAAARRSRRTQRPRHLTLLAWLSPDGRKLLLTRVLRTFAYGYLAVVLAVYLARLGYDDVRIGLIVSAAVAGSAAMTVLWTLLADRVGRRRTVAVLSLLMAAGGLLFAAGSSFVLLLLAAFTGTISATSSEVGAFVTVEQAILPETASPERRTWLFSLYAFVANIAQALGALFAGVAGGIALGAGLEGADALRPLFVLYAVIGLLNLAIFSTLSDRVEVARVEGERRLLGIHRSRGIVARLSALFALDAFAGALVVQSIVAYWFDRRWGFTPQDLGLLFFGVNVLSALSLLAAARLAHRIGLINTMVFTHIPSNVLLMLVPLMPTGALAATCFLARMSISQMDVPTRQSYTMAVVDPDERVAAAGLTNVARGAGSTFAPAITGYLFSLSALATPFFVAGGLKIAYDLLVYRGFRALRPPEERVARRPVP